MRPNLHPLPRADVDERRLAAWALLCCLVLLGAMAGPFFAGQIYVADDLGEFHLPLADFYSRQLQAGEAFDWMPSLYSGFYLTGEGQLGGYHPLRWLLYRWLPLGAAFDLSVLLSYVLMFVGAYGMLRRWLERRDAACFGSLVFTFSGFNLLHFVHPNAIAVVAHIPWLLWLGEVAIREGRSRRGILAQASIALLTASQLLLGYPQYVWFSLIVELGMVAWLLKSTRQTWGGASWCLMKLFGGMIGAVQLLPSLDALADSSRQSATAAFINLGSLHPWNLIQLVAPYLFQARVVGQNTHELGLYAGAAPFLLCVWLIATHRRLGRHRALVCGGLVLGGFAVLLAFGEFGPLYQVQTWLPLVGKFRFPCRAIVLLHLAIAIGSAAALAVLVRKRRELREARATAQGMLPVWCVVAIGLLLAGAVPAAWPDRVSAWPLIWIGPALLLTAALLLRQAALGSRRALFGLILFTAADLGCYGLSYAVFRTADLNVYAGNSLAAPSAQLGARVSCPTSRGPRIGNRMLLAGARRADGYAGLEPAKQLDYKQLAPLRLAGVAWLYKSTIGAGARSSDWSPIESPLERARLVARTEPRESLRNLSELPLEVTAVLDPPVELPASLPGTARLIFDRPGRIEIETTAPSRQLLILAESFHSGWQVSVDGAPAPVLRVNGDFLGCLVAPGVGRVVFEFRPRSLWVGRLVSACGLSLLTCFVLVRTLSSMHRPAQPTSPSERSPSRLPKNLPEIEHDAASPC